MLSLELRCSFLRLGKSRGGSVHAATFFIILQFAHLLGRLIDVGKDAGNRVAITSLEDLLQAVCFSKEQAMYNHRDLNLQVTV